MFLSKSIRISLTILIIIVAAGIVLAVAFTVFKKDVVEAPPEPAKTTLDPIKPKPTVALEPRILTGRYRLVGLYGSPNLPALGALGEQTADASVTRVKQLAEEYKPYSKEPILPTFEIITTLASGSPTGDNDFSKELNPETILPWIKAAQAADVYVILDLQPGNDGFLDQAKMYEQLLLEPNVGLALDPEWRLEPGKMHMKQVGWVSAAEINQTSTWLADLTKSHNLAQKIFLVHQFKLAMIPDRNQLDSSRPELAYTVQMDGLGTQTNKQGTWRTIRADAPPTISFGWKNFYDEDKPMLTPEETMKVSPQPWYISYQ